MTATRVLSMSCVLPHDAKRGIAMASHPYSQAKVFNLGGPYHCQPAGWGTKK